MAPRALKRPPAIPTMPKQEDEMRAFVRRQTASFGPDSYAPS
jgi:hypothetical protein